MAQIVGREHRDAGCAADAGDRSPQPIRGDAGEQWRVRVAILTWRECALERVGEYVGQVDP